MKLDITYARKGKIQLAPTEIEVGKQVVWRNEVYKIASQFNPALAADLHVKFLNGTSKWINKNYLTELRKLVIEFNLPHAGISKMGTGPGVNRKVKNQLDLYEGDWEYALLKRRDDEELDFVEIWGDGNQYFSGLYGKPGVAKLLHDVESDTETPEEFEMKNALAKPPEYSEKDVYDLLVKLRKDEKFTQDLNNFTGDFNFEEWWNKNKKNAQKINMVKR